MYLFHAVNIDLNYVSFFYLILFIASSTNAGYEKDMATARNTSNSIHQPDDNLEQILNVNSLSELNKHVELRTSTEDSSSTTCTVPNGLPIQVPPQSCKTEDMTDTNVMQDSIQELPRQNIVQENQVIGHDINNISMKTKIKNWFRRPRFFMVTVANKSSVRLG